jgi:hypothetical protein
MQARAPQPRPVGRRPSTRSSASQPLLGAAGFALAIGGIWAEPTGNIYGRI